MATYGPGRTPAEHNPASPPRPPALVGMAAMAMMAMPMLRWSEAGEKPASPLFQSMRSRFPLLIQTTLYQAPDFSCLTRADSSPLRPRPQARAAPRRRSNPHARKRILIVAMAPARRDWRCDSNIHLSQYKRLSYPKAKLTCVRLERGPDQILFHGELLADLCGCPTWNLLFLEWA
ncbi:uncharacterized protein VTP21DRAFT_2309 [Calcarisporiella thermophila]|uniref:uncharacterized protein n=1 Tax=Calcarisporiella thermophila TaxID=911321 RepID=UPI0037425229